MLRDWAASFKIAFLLLGIFERARRKRILMPVGWGVAGGCPVLERFKKRKLPSVKIAPMLAEKEMNLEAEPLDN